MKINLKQIEQDVIGGLKDFQRETVERVYELFQNKQNRVLIADEVGLGKTLLARGVIAKMARYHKENLHDELFKVVYICSNSNIANQNLRKLNLKPGDVTVESVSDTRLSMQHLKIFEQENNEEVIDGYIQLIPLTPMTSFAMTSGCGTVTERALMFAILKRMRIFEPFEKELETLLIQTAFVGWEWASKYYEDRVAVCNEKTNGEYIRTMTKDIEAYIEEYQLFPQIEMVCKQIKAIQYDKITTFTQFVNDLRMMFARISVERMNPDLVILDEFQRFKFLISEDTSSETGLLANRFLKGNEFTNILMLSATPYKLYSTLEEIDEAEGDDHYAEFYQVMDFLLQREEKKQQFKEIWQDFSNTLREVKVDQITILEAKNKAEDAMYQGVARTERISAIDTGDFIDDSSVKTTLQITEQDVLSYIEAEKLLKEIGLNQQVPVDYIKSSPYILSFMNQYKLKQKVEEYFKQNPKQISLANKRDLWISKNKINKYQELEPTNARLEKLKEVAFDNHSELLLWIPPSKPYYKPEGVYKDKDYFSKVLIFSAWEMVPRMIATMISYEAERRTVGKLVAKNKDKKNTNYFAEAQKRYPLPRLRFNVDKGSANSMSMFCLLYPSKNLSDLYNPIKYLNEGKNLKEIEKDLIEQINLKILKYKNKQAMTNRIDDRWYSLMPLLMDDQDHVQNWFANRFELLKGEDDKEDDKDKGFQIHINQLEQNYQSFTELELGKMPEDLPEVLAKMAIGSPAVCAYRSNGNNSVYATQFAKAVLDLFNRQEATAIVELSKPKRTSEAHWKNVLSYCCDGNFQALFDEYIHLLIESSGAQNEEEPYQFIHQTILSSLNTKSATYKVDTYKTLKARIEGTKEKNVLLRSHYAVGFYKDAGDNETGVNRKESVRNSFNSPFRPFVLATTSVGQEGLDFHLYCRKIMHWNLPTNPVDLEQREGRVNRFKCLAIRQNIAHKFGQQLHFEKDVWKELFDYAKENYKEKYPELIPFWCLPDDQEIKIERIVPLYPMSKDIGSYRRLIKILSLYRVTLGQARQEELLEYLLENNEKTEYLKELFINLSPYYKLFKDK